MKNILITGGTGFIGKKLVEELSETKYNLFLLSRKNQEIRRGKLILGDITKKETLKIPKKIDTVIHLAALTNSDKKGKEAYEEFKKVNFDGTINLLETCKTVKKFIYLSSVDALGVIQNKILNESSISRAKAPYDISKLKTEQYLIEKAKEKKFSLIILRPSMVYGEGEIVDQMKVNVAIFNICKYVKQHFFLRIGNGKNHLPLTHVDNVIQGIKLAMQSKKSSEVYNISDDRSYSLKEVIGTIAKLEKIKFAGPILPKFIAKIMAGIAEFIELLTSFKAPLKISGVDYITQNRFFNIGKAKKELGYNPINLEKGMKKTIKWFQENNYL